MNSNQSSNNIMMKNETLKNMIVKLSEQAKQQFSNYDYDGMDLFDKCGQDKNINNFTYDIGTDNKNPINNSYNNNENFTQEYYLERYRNFIPSNLVTPTDFKKYTDDIIKMTDFSINNFNCNSTNIIDFIQAKLFSELQKNKYKDLNIFNWLRMYNELNDSKKISLNSYIENFNTNESYSVYQKLEYFFTQFSVDTKKEIIIAQIKKVKFMDCLQIIEVMDFTRKRREFIITAEEMNVSEKNVINSLISDTQFRVDEVLLIKTSGLRELKVSESLFGKKLVTVSMKNIKQLTNN